MISLMKILLSLLMLLAGSIIGLEGTFIPEGPYEGPNCTLMLENNVYRSLGKAIISIDQNLMSKSNVESNIVHCSASYPLDFEMTGVATQLMRDNLRSYSQYKTVVDSTTSGTKSSYIITVSLTNLLAPRRFKFYKLGDKKVYKSFSIIRSGAIAFPDMGQIVDVKSDREILTLPCISSDLHSNSLKLTKYVDEQRQSSNETKVSEKLIRTTTHETITIVEDEYPQGGDFLTYNQTKGFLLNTTHFKDSHGVFSCVYNHSNSNKSEERFIINILPKKDHVVEPEQKEVIVFQNGKLHLSCRSTQEVVLTGNFNGAYININSTKVKFRTHLKFQAEYNLENPTMGSIGTIDCTYKADSTKEIHTWKIRSLDMWNNSRLNLTFEGKKKKVTCRSEEIPPKLSYILCGSESNCRHRLPCFLPDNSCPSSERIKYGSRGKSSESIIDFSTEEQQFSQGVIGCSAGNISLWTYYIKGFDGNIYKDWKLGEVKKASALIEIVEPKEQLYAGGTFSFVCRFSTFISDGEVQWYYKRENDAPQKMYKLSTANDQRGSPVKTNLTLENYMTHIVCSVPERDGKAFWNVSRRITIENTERPTEKTLGYSKKPIFVRGQTGNYISCAAHGIPQPNIEWFKQKANIPREFQQIKTNNEDKSVQLMFPPIKQEHAGVYICKASNVVDTLTQEFHVEVRDEKGPSFANQSVNHTFFIGDNEKMNCIVESYPRPNITWTYPRTMNSSILSVYITEIGLKTISTIHLNPVSEEVEGEYTCTATNEFGNASQNHIVKSKEKDSPVLGIVIGTSVAIVALIIPLVFVIWRLHIAKKEIRDLTAAEVDEFFKGNPNEVKHVEKSCADDALEIQAKIFSSMAYNKSYEIAKDSLDIDETTRLGEGAFGMVLMAKIKGMEDSVAVKTVKPNSEVSYFKALLSELKIMIYIGKNDNVVNLIGAYTENIKKRELYIAVELCQHGSLDKYLKGVSQKRLFQDEIVNDEVPLPYEDDQQSMERNPDILMLRRMELEDGGVTKTWDLIRWSYQIANGMDYLASKKVIHADLSTRNVLLHQDGTVRITDFGLSRQLYDYTQYVKKNQSPLPWRWMAIESLRNMRFSTQSDVWAFGVTMWEIFSLAAMPYPGKSWTVDFVDELVQGLRMKKPRYATCQIYRIMYDCWMDDPEDRPSFSTLKTSIYEVAYGEQYLVLD